MVAAKFQQETLWNEKKKFVQKFTKKILIFSKAVYLTTFNKARLPLGPLSAIPVTFLLTKT